MNTHSHASRSLPYCPLRIHHCTDDILDCTNTDTHPPHMNHSHWPSNTSDHASRNSTSCPPHTHCYKRDSCQHIHATHTSRNNIPSWRWVSHTHSHENRNSFHCPLRMTNHKDDSHCRIRSIYIPPQNTSQSRSTHHITSRTHHSDANHSLYQYKPRRISADWTNTNSRTDLRYKTSAMHRHFPCSRSCCCRWASTSPHRDNCIWCCIRSQHTDR